MPKQADSKRARLEAIRTQMVQERESFLPHYRELADYILPNRPRFMVTDANRGDRRNNKLNDLTAAFAARTLTSGMMSGLTSPARQWFRLTTASPELDEKGPVKSWLYIVHQRMMMEFSKSDLYNVLPSVYDDLGTFATAAGSIEENFDPQGAAFRFNSFPVGSYCLALDANHRVAVFFREFRMTVRQVVQDFAERDSQGRVADWSNFSPRVRQMYDDGKMGEAVDVCHFILPNEEYDPERLHAKYKRWASIYYEKGQGEGTAERDVYLRESGFDEFPVFGPRWSVTGEDTYGTNCPGMMALGDVKQLQLMQKRKLQAIEKQVNPPMVYPLSMRTVKTSILPGDNNYVDERDGAKGIRPAHEVSLDLNHLMLEIQRVQEAIKKAYFADLFLMLADDTRNERPTAREIDERHEEKLLVLGPVLQQLDLHLLKPIVDNAFRIMEKRGMFPPAPRELAGVDLKVEFISMMANSQKLVAIGGLDRLMQTTLNFATVVPDVLDKLDMDQVVDTYADILSAPPGVVRTDEQVAALREGKAKAMQQQAQAEQMQAMGKTVKDLSGASLEGENVLKKLLDQAQAGQLTPQ